ncbi:MAG: tryptophan--tRNA ligase [Oligoflexia bacterium]|nr:tryptophan--tRNA ligase [Oligoflexia bacterium]MBF0366918.1 tryptophan--tRNA ligase [Oligoflexia bacterium]
MLQQTLLSGIQPTNKLTLGNYLGAIKNWTKLQKDYDCYFLIVDLHSITLKYDPKDLLNNTLYTIAAYMASGIDPKRCKLIVQSHVPQHLELAWILTCNSYMGELKRMTQFKDKSARAGVSIPVGLFTYPVLMAADILLYQADVIPVGEDQRQHVELTRDIASRMNLFFEEEFFVMPSAFIPKVGARIMDLQKPTNKMSKSASQEGGAIYLTDSDKEISNKVKKATTDSGAVISYEEEKAGIKNLLEIQAAITGKSIEELVRSYEGKMYGHLKVETAEIVVAELKPVREKILQYMSDPSELLQVIKTSEEAARNRAEETMRKVRTKVGFLCNNK